jgi:hypothetical protein
MGGDAGFPHELRFLLTGCRFLPLSCGVPRDAALLERLDPATSASPRRSAVE